MKESMNLIPFLRSVKATARAAVSAAVTCMLPAVLLLPLLLPSAAGAELTPLDNRALDQVWGQSGFSIALKNFQGLDYFDSLSYIGSDNGYIQFNDLKVHDGTGGPYRFNYDFGTTTGTGAIFIDVFNAQIAPEYTFGTTVERGMIGIRAPEWEQDIAFTVGHFIFADPNTLGSVDLGALEAGPIHMPYWEYYLSSPAHGSGLAWEHIFQMTMDQASYQYRSWAGGGDSLEIDKLYMGGSFTDYGGDDPTNPATWKPNNSQDFGYFQIGDLFGDIANSVASDPARLDVGEYDLHNDGNIYGMVNLQLPMSGSIRFEDVNFGGTDFGPGAIDGLHAYRLNLRLIP